MNLAFLNGRVTLHAGDSRDILKTLADASIDSIVTDPPYALVSIGKRFGGAGAAGVVVPDGKSGAYARASAGFMGKQWDTGETAFAVEFWAQCLRVLKPGGHVVAFSGTRTYHRLAVAIEDAGFEIRDQLAWAYGSGFPKSHDVSKGIDKAAGAVREKVRVAAPATSAGSLVGSQDGDRPWRQEAIERGYHEKDGDEPATDAAREWQGWGTALKPSWEPIVLARKPLSGTVAANVLAHGTGALNVDGCRVGTEGGTAKADIQRGEVNGDRAGTSMGRNISFKSSIAPLNAGRWPANIVHDGSDEVVGAFPDTKTNPGTARSDHKAGMWGIETNEGRVLSAGSEGSAARFFYSAKADADDRLGSKHPTVKPVDLMQWLCRLVTPPGGTVLDPFAGSGSTGEAAWREGFRAVLIEREAEYQDDIARRMALCLSGPDERARESIKAKTKGQPVDAGPLFGGLTESGGGTAARSTGTSPIKSDDRANRNEELAS